MARNKKTRKPIPGDPNDPEGLHALLTRHLIWMETHHFSVRTGKYVACNWRDSSAGASIAASPRHAT